MKKNILILFVILFVFPFVSAQERIALKNIEPSLEMENMMDFMGIYSANIRLSSKQSITNPVSIICAKCEDGVLYNDTIDLSDCTSHNRKPANTYIVRGMGQPKKLSTDSLELKVRFYLSGFSQDANSKMKIGNYKPNDFIFFSMADIYHSIPRNEYIPMFVFIPPTPISNEMQSYCAVRFSKVLPKDWRTKLHLKSYTIYYFKFK